jgi:hypothetical protein
MITEWLKIRIDIQKWYLSALKNVSEFPMNISKIVTAIALGLVNKKKKKKKKRIDH